MDVKKALIILLDYEPVEGEERFQEAYQTLKSAVENKGQGTANKQSEAITLCKEMSMFHGPQALHEWFVENKHRINAVIA
jgi:hypothetical protein